MSKDEIKNAILGIIDNADRDITADEIYNNLRQEVDPGRTQEATRKYIRELVNEDRNLVGSGNTGYFKINSPERRDRAIRYLTGRIGKLQSRVETIEKLWQEEYPQIII